MQRLISISAQVSGGKIILEDKKEVHYINDVLRFKPEERLVIVDRHGNEHIARAGQLLKDKVIFSIESTLRPERKLPVLTIACAIPKKSKFDDIIDKLTQVGVDRIIPMYTERSVVKLDAVAAVTRLARWKKIAHAAAQQSHRCTLPEIESPKAFREVVSACRDHDLKLIPTLTAVEKRLRQLCAQHKPKKILVLIGPEGDFTPGEVALAKKSGCVPVSLGESVLRVETAAVAVASFIRLYEDH